LIKILDLTWGVSVAVVVVVVSSSHTHRSWLAAGCYSKVWTEHQVLQCTRTL